MGRLSLVHRTLIALVAISALLPIEAAIGQSADCRDELHSDLWGVSHGCGGGQAYRPGPRRA